MLTLRTSSTTLIGVIMGLSKRRKLEAAVTSDVRPCRQKSQTYNMGQVGGKNSDLIKELGEKMMIRKIGIYMLNYYLIIII